jgi:hypothetical protein
LPSREPATITRCRRASHGAPLRCAPIVIASAAASARAASNRPNHRRRHRHRLRARRRHRRRAHHRHLFRHRHRRQCRLQCARRTARPRCRRLVNFARAWIPASGAVAVRRAFKRRGNAQFGVLQRFERSVGAAVRTVVACVETAGCALTGRPHKCLGRRRRHVHRRHRRPLHNRCRHRLRRLRRSLHVGRPGPRRHRTHRRSAHRHQAHHHDPCRHRRNFYIATTLRHRHHRRITVSSTSWMTSKVSPHTSSSSSPSPSSLQSRGGGCACGRAGRPHRSRCQWQRTIRWCACLERAPRCRMNEHHCRLRTAFRGLGQ